MSKQSERDALAAMIAASRVQPTVCPTADMDGSLSASFKQLGIDKRTQRVKMPQATHQKKKAVKIRRNWEAQRRYDEAHGTVNGYDPRIEEANAFHRHEMEE